MKIGQLGSKLLFTLIGNSFLKLKSKEAKSKNTNRIQITLKVFLTASIWCESGPRNGFVVVLVVVVVVVVL